MGIQSAAFNPVAYLTDPGNKDVFAAYEKAVGSGQQITANDFATQHYQNFGQAEGRQGNWGQAAPAAAPSPVTTSTPPPVAAPPAAGGIQGAATNARTQIGPDSLGDNAAYISYLTDPKNSDLMNAYNAEVGGGRQISAVNWAREHYDKYGKYENRAGVPTPQTAQKPPVPGVSVNVNNAPPVDWAQQMRSIPTPVFGARAITPQETVAGQLNSLLAEDSPYLQANRAGAIAQMAGRGMLDSSMTAEAGQAAAIKAAGPIAAQDASTYGAAGLSAQNATQEAATKGYTAQLGTVQTAQEAAANLWRDAANNDARAQLETSLKQMDVAVDLERFAANDRQSFSAAIQPVMQQYSVDFTNIQNDPNYASPEDKQAALDDLKEIYKTNLNAIGAIYKQPISWGSYLPKSQGGTAPEPLPKPAAAVTAPEQKYGEGQNDPGYRQYVDSFRPSIMFQSPMDYRSWKEQQQNVG